MNKIIEERSAGVVFFRKSSTEKLFLLLHYPSGHWDFVKGKIEEGETPMDTAIRESREETSITDLEFIDGFNETIEYNFQAGGKLIHKQVIFFLAKTYTKKVIISQEHLDHLWLDFENAIKKITYENAKLILKKANKLLS